MALDYGKLSDKELEAIANGDFSKLSEETLTALANEPAIYKEETAKTPSQAEMVARMAAPAATAASYAGPVVPAGVNAGQMARSAMTALGNRPLLQTAGDIAGIATHGVPWGTVARAGMNALGANPTTIAEGLQTAGNVMRAAPAAIGQAGGALLRGAGRVAGPVGLAMDVNDAMQFAREQQLGQRLEQGQGQRAQQAFRNMNVQYGYQPTAQEARNVLAAGNVRDIQAFGGEDRLQRIIREEAARRVMGPVAPR